MALQLTLTRLSWESASRGWRLRVENQRSENVPLRGDLRSFEAHKLCVGTRTIDKNALVRMHSHQLTLSRANPDPKQTRMATAMTDTTKTYARLNFRFKKEVLPPSQWHLGTGPATKLTLTS